MTRAEVDRTRLLALAERAMVAHNARKPMTVTHEEMRLLRRLDEFEWDDALREAWRRADLPVVPEYLFGGQLGDYFSLPVVIDDPRRQTDGRLGADSA